MNKLPTAKRTQIINCLVEGMSMRATSRLCDVSINTVTKLFVDLGVACSAYQAKVMRGLTCKRIQCDEIWAFVGCKEKQATNAKKAKGQGDCWAWLALDADTKLIPAWHIGPRDGNAAYHFMQDLASRLAHRVQLTTDGHRPYLSAVDDAFGGEIDYAVLNKIYGKPESGPDTRYSPAQCLGARKDVIAGKPDAKHVSTSFIERANLTMRMGNRRFTRLTNAFSKKLDNHRHSVAIQCMYYNFCKIHTTLRVTPAMEAGISDHVWEIADLIALLDKTEQKNAA